LTLSRGAATHCGAEIEVIPLVFLPKGNLKLSTSTSTRLARGSNVKSSVDRSVPASRSECSAGVFVSATATSGQLPFSYGLLSRDRAVSLLH
jgi:hypothetical protein